MKRKKHLLNILLTLGSILLIFTLIQCTSTSKDQETMAETAHAEIEKDHDDHGEEEVVKLSQEEMEEFGVELAKAGPGVLERHLEVTGEIVVDPARLAHIVPRFAGIVKEIKKFLGQNVKKGEVLAIIESNESLTAYEVTSLIDGTIIDMHLAKGELVTDAGHAYTVADLSVVWANLNIYQKDLDQVKLGQKVEISALSGNMTATGTITYISPIINENTRTAVARVIINNRDRQWKPGLFVNANITIDKTRVPVIIPKTALQFEDEENVIFVQKEDGYVMKPIKVGRQNTHSVEVVAGLKPGEVYVAKGAFILKSEYLKDSFGGGHGH